MDEIVMDLIAGLRSADVDVRRWSSWRLGQIRDTEAVPFLMNHAKDSDMEVRCIVINSLWRIGCRDAIPVLEEALNDSEAGVRNLAKEALDNLKQMQG
jgi:HEAT repeat protein